MTEEEALNNFKAIQRNDRLKDQFCEENGIDIFRIKYDDNIEIVLVNILKTIGAL